MSRHAIPARLPGFTVAVGWDNPLQTFFGTVLRDQEVDDPRDPVVLWLGASADEVRRAEDLVAPLAPHAELTAVHVALLRADRAAALDRGPSPLQRELLHGAGGAGGAAELPGGDPWLTENPNVSYPEMCLYCDRDGVLGAGTYVPEGMLPIARAPWLRLHLAATGLALRSDDGSAWVVPGLPEAGEDSDAALDAVMAFKARLDAALDRPPATRRNSTR